MKKKTLYEFLGVEPEATQEEIKTAALSLARKFHPSKYPGNPRVAARFNKIKRVYNTLANPQKRAAYDATLAKEPAQPAQNPSPRPEKPIINTVHQASEKNTQIVREKQPASEAAKANSVQNSSPQPQKVQTQYASQEKNTTNEPQQVGEMNKLRTKIHWFLNLIAAFLFMGIGAYFLLIDPAILTEYVDKSDFFPDKLPYITLSSWVILGLGILILVHTLWATFTTILTKNKNHVEDIKPDDNTQTKPVIKETEAAAAKNPAQASAKKPPATVPQKTQKQDNPPKRVTKETDAAKNKALATAKKPAATVPPQKTAANPQKRVAQKAAAAAKKPAPATAKKPVATLPQKTPDRKEEKMDGRAAKNHWLGYSFAILLICIGTYLLWIEPTLFTESVNKVDRLQNQLPYVTLGAWMIFLLGLLILLYNLFKTLTTTSTRNKNKETKPLKEPEAVGQASSKAAAEKREKTTALGEQPATPPQKTQEEDSEKEKIVGPTKIHWLGYSFALLLIIIPAYLLFIEPTLLNNLLKPIEFLQDKRVYIKLGLQGLLLLGILLLTKFQPFKNKNRVNEIKPVKKTPAHPQKPAAIEASAAQNPSAQNPQHPKKLSVSDVLAKHQKKGEKTHTVRWVSEKILYRADIHGFGYIMGLFFIGISIYFLLFNPEGLKIYVDKVDFLQDKLSFVTLGLQTVLGLGVFILLHTLFQQFTTTLMITSERIIARFGLISIRQIEIKHAQFENLEIKQSLLGKILGFGTLKIRGTRGKKGVGGIKIKVSNVTSPKQFEKRLMRIIKQTAYHQI